MASSSASADVPARQQQPQSRRRTDEAVHLQAPLHNNVAVRVEEEDEALLSTSGRSLHVQRNDGSGSRRHGLTAAVVSPPAASVSHWQCGFTSKPNNTLLLTAGLVVFLLGVIVALLVRDGILGGYAASSTALMKGPNMPLLWVDVHGAGGPGSPTRREVFAFPRDSRATVADVKASVAAALGIPAVYIVLFQRRAAIADHLYVAARAPSRMITALGAVKSAHGSRDELALEEARIAREEDVALSSFGVSPGDSLDAHVRPIRGDHVHVAFAMFHAGRRLAPLADRSLVGLTAEGGHVANVFPHFGVHTGGAGWYDNGVIHIHPGTSWSWFSGVEGCGCTLGAFLEGAGIVAWAADGLRYPAHTPVMAAPPLVGGAICLDATPELRYSDGRGVVPAAFTWTSGEYGGNRSIICDTATHVWQAYLWESIDDFGNPPAAVVSGAHSLERLWLPFADAMLTLSYEARAGGTAFEGEDAGGASSGTSATYPFPLQQTRDAIQRATPDGFDGRLYPRTPKGTIAVDG